MLLSSLTIARSDFGRMASFYQRLAADPRFELRLALGAGHWDEKLGRSGDEVEKSGIAIDWRLPHGGKSPSQQAATVLSSVGEWLEARRPDALLLLGDRFEMLAAAQAATLLRVPVIHVGGGHLTLGAIDERIRHAISKLAAVHFVASDTCAQRVADLHEDRSRIFVTGAPELEALRLLPEISRAEFSRRSGFPEGDFLLATIHPETQVDAATNLRYADEVRAFVKHSPLPILITAPCLDPGHEAFLELAAAVPELRPGSRFIPNLGMELFVAAMRHAKALIGNSSSGIIESASCRLPVLNLGERQKGRDRASNVIDAPFQRQAIDEGLKRLLDPAFRSHCQSLDNPYGDGFFSDRALPVLSALPLPLGIDKSW